MKSTPDGYSKAQIALHWAVLVLIIFQQMGSGPMEEAWRAYLRGQGEVGGFQPHALGGVLVLLLVMWRLVLRWRRGVPLPPDSDSKLLDMAAKGVHGLIYVLLVLIPVSGITAWGFGVKVAGAVHSNLFGILFLTVMVHAFAAIYHHYILRDKFLRRMMVPDQSGR